MLNFARVCCGMPHLAHPRVNRLSPVQRKLCHDDTTDRSPSDLDALRSPKVRFPQPFVSAILTTKYGFQTVEDNYEDRKDCTNEFCGRHEYCLAFPRVVRIDPAAKNGSDGP